MRCPPRIRAPTARFTYGWRGRLLRSAHVDSACGDAGRRAAALVRDRLPPAARHRVARTDHERRSRRRRRAPLDVHQRDVRSAVADEAAAGEAGCSRCNVSLNRRRRRRRRRDADHRVLVASDQGRAGVRGGHEGDGNGRSVHGAWYFERKYGDPGHPIEAHYRAAVVLAGALAASIVNLPVKGLSAGQGVGLRRQPDAATSRTGDARTSLTVDDRDATR